MFVIEAEPVGLARSDEKGAALVLAGVTVLVGEPGDLDVLRRGVADADGIIHTAFGLHVSRIGELAYQRLSSSDGAASGGE